MFCTPGRTASVLPLTSCAMKGTIRLVWSPKSTSSSHELQLGRPTRQGRPCPLDSPLSLLDVSFMCHQIIFEPGSRNYVLDRRARVRWKQGLNTVNGLRSWSASSFNCSQYVCCPWIPLISCVKWDVNSQLLEAGLWMGFALWLHTYTHRTSYIEMRMYLGRC